MGLASDLMTSLGGLARFPDDDSQLGKKFFLTALFVLRKCNRCFLQFLSIAGAGSRCVTRHNSQGLAQDGYDRGDCERPTWKESPRQVRFRGYCRGPKGKAARSPGG